MSKTVENGREMQDVAHHVDAGADIHGFFRGARPNSLSASWGGGGSH